MDDVVQPVDQLQRGVEQPAAMDDATHQGAGSVEQTAAQLQRGVEQPAAMDHALNQKTGDQGGVVKPAVIPLTGESIARARDSVVQPAAPNRPGSAREGPSGDVVKTVAQRPGLSETVGVPNEASGEAVAVQASESVQDLLDRAGKGGPWTGADEAARRRYSL